MIVSFKKHQNLAAEGRHNAVFADCKESIDEKTKDKFVTPGVNILTPDGKTLHLGKPYNFSKRGQAIMQKDLESWQGRKFTDEEADKCDLDALLVGKRVTVEVKHRKIKGRMVACITAFHPAAAPASAPQAKADLTNDPIIIQPVTKTEAKPAATPAPVAVTA